MKKKPVGWLVGVRARGLVPNSKLACSTVLAMNLPCQWVPRIRESSSRQVLFGEAETIVAGDAARALYLAHRLGYRLPRQALRETTAWLADPARWEHNGGDQRYSDKNMAALHFADALVAALDAREVSDKTALEQAASKIAGL